MQIKAQIIKRLNRLVHRNFNGSAIYYINCLKSYQRTFSIQNSSSSSYYNEISKVTYQTSSSNQSLKTLLSLHDLFIKDAKANKHNKIHINNSELVEKLYNIHSLILTSLKGDPNQIKGHLKDIISIIDYYKYHINLSNNNNSPITSSPLYELISYIVSYYTSLLSVSPAISHYSTPDRILLLKEINRYGMKFFSLLLELDYNTLAMEFIHTVFKLQTTTPLSYTNITTNTNDSNNTHTTPNDSTSSDDDGILEPFLFIPIQNQHNNNTSTNTDNNNNHSSSSDHSHYSLSLIVKTKLYQILHKRSSSSSLPLPTLKGHNYDLSFTAIENFNIYDYILTVCCFHLEDKYTPLYRYLLGQEQRLIELLLSQVASVNIQSSLHTSTHTSRQCISISQILLVYTTYARIGRKHDILLQASDRLLERVYTDLNPTQWAAMLYSYAKLDYTTSYTNNIVCLYVNYIEDLYMKLKYKIDLKELLLLLKTTWAMCVLQVLSIKV